MKLRNSFLVLTSTLPFSACTDVKLKSYEVIVRDIFRPKHVEYKINTKFKSFVLCLKIRLKYHPNNFISFLLRKIFVVKLIS